MEKLYVQMYSLGFENKDPMPVSFKNLAEMGYTGVEFAGSNYGGMTVEEMKKALADAGLEAISSHVAMDKMEEDIPYVAAIGAKMIICPMHRIADKAEALELAAELNRIGKIAKEHGLKIGYHNHTQEFYEDEGKHLLDYLIENTDPDTVGFELDCGWASCAGINPVEYINRYAGRFMAIHVKENGAVVGVDKPKTKDDAPMKFEIGEDGKPVFPPEFIKMMEERNKLNVPTGQGIVDWKAVKAAADAQAKGTMYYIVEREWSYNQPQDRLACLKEDAAWLLQNL